MKNKDSFGVADPLCKTVAGEGTGRGVRGRNTRQGDDNDTRGTARSKNNDKTI